MISCNKDPKEADGPINMNKEINYILEGTWNTTSILQNNEEVLGPDELISKLSTTYKPSGDVTGNYSRAYTILDTDLTETGSYEVSGDGRILTLTNSDDEKIVAHITMGSGTYVMMYAEDGDKIWFKATKQ